MIDEVLIDRVGLRLVQELTKMAAADARKRLAEFGLAETEVAQLLELCKSPISVQINHYDRRKQCFTALWILGGSWSQIARIFNVTRQTIMDAAKKNGGLYRAQRMANSVVFERLAEYNACYWDNVPKLDEMEPAAVAEWLMANTDTDDER